MEYIGLTACSNALKREQAGEIRVLTDYMERCGKKVLVSSCIYEKNGIFSGSGEERAGELMKLFQTPGMTDIYDLSGGDMANEVLDWLDYEQIKESSAVFWGYSDLTTVINAIYAQTGKSSVLYQIRNLVRPDTGALQRLRYENREELFCPSFTMVQGEKMQGVVVGGNVRCFLKLAGTPYFPDLKDKLLLLEARGGRVPQMVTYLSQLRSCGAFRKIGGILLGTFTQMEAEGCKPDILSLVRRYAGTELPIAVTREIGHGPDARAIRIGDYLKVGW